MQTGYINSPDSETGASEYKIEIEYDNGEVLEEQIINYSYSNVFEWIKDRHNGKNDRKVKSIKIDLI
ncbi:hypothetical protein [Clostridium ganghwense]|uniref:Uncharacterized protein n=1 Tax=Clostridium ganghwense TaxID=312089 RepID=A0ABT4CWN6_9CLOT|nr:hypothetical protein [Clostridium ganghwense]MCY6372451.1 hypothetical protein [Clostridium ganghwense]